MRRSFRRRWHEAFAKLWANLGVEKYFRVAQGAVIEKTDGTCFLVRNFDTSEPWMKGSPWKNIRRVYRSPLHYLAAKAKAASHNAAQVGPAAAEKLF